MRTILHTFLAMATLLLLAVAPVHAQQGKGLTEGTYFIVSTATGQALRPVQATAAQNVQLSAFNRSGLQQWVFKRVLDAKKRPTGRWTIHLAGPSPLYLRPYPVPDNHTAIVVPAREASFTLVPRGEGYEIRSHQLNGDAMQLVPSAPLPDEAYFRPSDGSAAFVWQLVRVD